MSALRQSNLRTVGFAAAIAFACSLLVSTAVYFLRPIAQAYAAIDLNRAVLEASGVLSGEAAADDRAVVAGFLELDTRLVDLGTGEFTSAVDPTGYDFRSLLDDPGGLVPIPPALDRAGLQARPPFAQVYLLRDGDAIERIVLPIYARGMWSTIHAVIALESDFSTIAGVAFYAHGETPGIGDRIEADAWRASWIGKRIYSPEGELRFRIQASPDPSMQPYSVDSITGATVTVNAIASAMSYWFSEHAYAPLLQRLREQGS